MLFFFRGILFLFPFLKRDMNLLPNLFKDFLVTISKKSDFLVGVDMMLLRDLKLLC
jgi:hypothetical protein